MSTITPPWITLCTALLIGCIAVSGLVPPVHAASLLPAIPCEFYGNITINGGGAPPGTVIAASINGEQRGSITSTQMGRYGGSANFDQRLMVAGTEEEQGQPIVFRVNGVVANESGVFSAGHSSRQDLNAFVTGPAPAAHFTTNISVGLAPMTVRFTDISDCANITGLVWNFGDGNSSSVQAPVHTYTKTGNYTATLTVSNSSGSNTTVPGQGITVYPKGDLNRNWRVDIGDVTTVAYMAAGLVPADPNADFNEQPGIDAGDAAKIAWYYVGKILTL
jgi:PKD repeat protein